MQITRQRLKQIIAEEKKSLFEAYSYREKHRLVMDALASLREAQSLESMSDIGDDPDLNEIVSMLEGYADAVSTMASME